MHLAGDTAGFNAAFRGLAEATKGITSGTFTVNRDNVLAAAHIIDSTADNLQETFRNSRNALVVQPPGNDEVSLAMAEAWSDVLLRDDDSYRNRIADYIVGLRKLAVQLGDAARAYGYTEEEIEAAYRNGGSA
jgi:hypothetical protein